MNMLASAIIVPASVASAHGTPMTTTLTMLVRDADGQPLPTIRVEVYLPQPPAPPRGVAQVLTDATGRVTIARLDRTATYVVQFHGGASTIIDGEERGFVPIQAVADQNAGQELLAPDDVPGFPVHLDDERDATVRFVIGGTFSAGDRVAAVPMIDLAASDDAPVRPVDPRTGAELTPAYARTFHAVIGQPWRVAHEPMSPSNLTRGVTAGADTRPPGTETDTRAAGGARPAPTAAAQAVIGLLVVTIGVLATAVVVLVVRQRGRAR